MKIIMSIKVSIIIFVFVLSSNLIADTESTNQHKKIVDGNSINLGVIPTEIVDGTKALNMHGGLPVGQFQYHFTVAPFNENNRRLEHATILIQLSTQNRISGSGKNKL